MEHFLSTVIVFVCRRTLSLKNLYTRVEVGLQAESFALYIWDTFKFPSMFTRIWFSLLNFTAIVRFVV